jgi:tetratricopeptide (TPR) repeat protein
VPAIIDRLPGWSLGVKMKSKVSLAMLLAVLASSAVSMPAQAQGMMEGTGLQGSAAGVGGGLGAGAYKLFNRNTEKAASSVGKSLNATSQAQGPTASEIKTKTESMTAAAKEKAEVDPAAAGKLWQELAQYRQKQFGKQDPVAAEAYKNAAMALLKGKQFSQAEDDFKMALGYCNRINGDKSPKSVAILQNLARSLKEQERAAEAIPYYKQALELQEKQPNADARSTFTTKSGLGEALYRSGTYADAEPLLKLSVEQGQANNYCSKEEMAALLDTYAGCLRKDNKADEAEQIAKQSQALKTK